MAYPRPGTSRLAICLCILFLGRASFAALLPLPGERGWDAVRPACALARWVEEVLQGEEAERSWRTCLELWLEQFRRPPRPTGDAVSMVERPMTVEEELAASAGESWVHACTSEELARVAHGAAAPTWETLEDVLELPSYWAYGADAVGSEPALPAAEAPPDGDAADEEGEAAAAHPVQAGLSGARLWLFLALGGMGGMVLLTLGRIWRSHKLEREVHGPRS